MKIEQRTANEIWQIIHDEDLFTRLIPIAKDQMAKRVEWVLKHHYSDMVEEASMMTTLVKNELVKLFKEAGYFPTENN